MNTNSEDELNLLKRLPEERAACLHQQRLSKLQDKTQREVLPHLVAIIHTPMAGTEQEIPRTRSPIRKSSGGITSPSLDMKIHNDDEEEKKTKKYLNVKQKHISKLHKCFRNNLVSKPHTLKKESSPYKTFVPVKLSLSENKSSNTRKSSMKESLTTKCEIIENEGNDVSVIDAADLTNDAEDDEPTMKKKSEKDCANANLKDVKEDEDIPEDELSTVVDALPVILSTEKNTSQLKGEQITVGVAKALRDFLFGGQSTSFNSTWRNQTLTFARPRHYALKYYKDGPTEVMAPLQCFILKHMLFVDDVIVPDLSKKLHPDASIQQRCLANAITEMIWRAGNKSRTVVTLAIGQHTYLTDCQYVEDKITEKMELFRFNNFNDLQMFIKKNLLYLFDNCLNEPKGRLFQASGSYGCICLLYSMLLSHGLDVSLEECSELPRGILSSTSESQFYKSQALVNLSISGRPVPNVFNGRIDFMEPTAGKLLVKHGIKSRCEVGFLSRAEHLDPNKNKIGSCLKTPYFPIWVSHMTSDKLYVMFSLKKDLLNDWKLERRFNLFVYQGLSQFLQTASIDMRLTVDNITPLIACDSEETSTVEEVVRTKWPDAVIVWNGFVIKGLRARTIVLKIVEDVGNFIENVSDHLKTIMERLTDILGVVRKNSGSTFHSCEPELIELMRQIDMMVEEKKCEWHEHLSTLAHQLGRKDEEIANMSKQLENANHEIGMLRQEILGSKKVKKSLVARYDDEIKKLRDELDSLNKKYSRLQKKTQKFHSQKTEQQNFVCDCHVKTAQIESLQKLVQELEERNSHHTKDIDGYQQNVGAEKEYLHQHTDTMQQQLLGYQGQLTRRQATLEQLEMTTASRIGQLECKLKSYKETCAQKDLTITSLKQQLSSWEKVVSENKSKTEQWNKQSSRLEEVLQRNDELRHMLTVKEDAIQKYEKKISNLIQQLTTSSRNSSTTLNSVKSTTEEGETNKSPNMSEQSRQLGELELENQMLHARVIELKEELACSYRSQQQVSMEQHSAKMKSASDVLTGYPSDEMDTESSSSAKSDIALSPASEFVHLEKKREEQLDNKIKLRIKELENMLQS